MSTIKDVARITGLSLGTISNFLNGKEIKKNNALLIEQAIRELNYVPNKFGRFLRSGDTKTIGIITNDISASFISKTSAILETELYRKGYEVFFCDSRGDLAIEANKLSFMIGHVVDVIILFPSSFYDPNIGTYLHSNIPIILCDEEVDNYQNYCHTVVYDNEQLAYDATNHFIANGHTQIACVSGSKDHYSTITRVKGYKRALQEHNLSINENDIYFCNFSDELSYKATLKIISSSNNTATLITANNMLVGFLRAAQERNCRIPHDMSYITFADASYYDILPVKPTYVFQDTDKFGYVLFKLLEEILTAKDQKTPPKKCIAPAYLVIGESVRNLKA